MASFYSMENLLKIVAHERAEELRLHAGEPPIVVLRGEARALDVPAVTTETLNELFSSIATAEQLKELYRCGDIHFIYNFQNSARFAVSAATRHENLSLKIRNLAR